MISVLKEAAANSFFVIFSFAGIATHYIPSSRLPALEDRLADLETSDHSVIQRVIEEFVEPVAMDKIGYLRSERERIDRYNLLYK